MRTCKSCGDARLYLEQPGENVFSFTFYACDPDWKMANAQQMALRLLRMPVYKFAHAGGKGDVPEIKSFLKVEDDRFALSSLYPGQKPGSVVVRVWETTGRAGMANFSGLLSEGQAVQVNMLEEGDQPVQGRGGAWIVGSSRLGYPKYYAWYTI